MFKHIAVIEHDGRVVFDAPLILNFLAIVYRGLGHTSLFPFTQTIYLSSSSWERPAKILPIFKCDDSSLFSNDRPISILPCLSKVFEKLIYFRFSAFLEKFDILSHHLTGGYKYDDLYIQMSPFW